MGIDSLLNGFGIETRVAGAHRDHRGTIATEDKRMNGFVLEPKNGGKHKLNTPRGTASGYIPGFYCVPFINAALL